MTRLLRLSCLALLIQLSINGSALAADDDEVVAPVRIENETMYAVEDAHVEELWNYLKTTFSGERVVAGYPVRTVESIEQFHDTYFDTPDRRLLRQWAGLRHRHRVGENGTIKDLIQLKVTPRFAEDRNDQNRYEIKFNYRREPNAREEDDTNEILTIVRRRQKSILRKSLAELGVNVEKVERFLVLQQERRRIYFRQGEKQLFTVTLDLTRGRAFFATGSFAQLELEISENAFTQADAAERERLLAFQAEINTIIESRFGKLRQDQAPKIVKMYELLNSQSIVGTLFTDYGNWVLLAAGYSGFFLLLLMARLVPKKRGKEFVAARA